MSSQREFQYYIVKYVPNAASGNEVKIGVILLEDQTLSAERSGRELPFAGVRFLEDWTDLNHDVSDVDLEVISAIVREIKATLEQSSIERKFPPLGELLQELRSAANGVVLGPPKGLVTSDPELALDDLATRYLRRPETRLL